MKSIVKVLWYHNNAHLHIAVHTVQTIVKQDFK